MAKSVVSSVAELNNNASFDLIEIFDEYEEDEPLNCDMIDVNTGVLMVMKITESSLLYGKVHVGDYFLTINGKTFKNRTEMFRIVTKAYPHMKLIVARPKSQPSTTTAENVTTVQQPAKSSTTKTGKDPNVQQPVKSSLSTTKNVSIMQQPVPSSVEKSDSPSSSDKEYTSIFTGSYKLTDPKKISVFIGFSVKFDREYLMWRVTSKSDKPLGLGIMHVAKENAVIVSSVQPNSSSAEFFKPGDRLLAVSCITITDKMCKKAILETKGNFDALIERSPKGTCETMTSARRQGSYTQPTSTNSEHVLGNPQVGYETAPSDVQAILTRQIPALIKSLERKSKKATQRGSSKTSDL